MKTNPLSLSLTECTHGRRGADSAILNVLAAAAFLLSLGSVSAQPATTTPAGDSTITQPATNPPPNTEVPPVPPTPVLETAPSTPSEPPSSAPAALPASTGDNGNGGLHLNFRNAPLNLVLEYLSDAAGFIIDRQAPDLRGTVDVWSKDPVTKDEAVKLLGSVLAKNGYSVLRDGRILTIISLPDDKTNPNVPVSVGSDPNAMDASDEVVTQIIPVRYANATQLMNNLQVLLPTSATLTVNESANSLLLVAPKRDIRRMLKIVGALDTSISSVTSLKVFQLHYADAKQLASEIQQLFTTQGNQGGGGFRAQLFNMFRGGGPGGPGGFGAPGGGTSSGGNAAGSKVTATADDYSNSLIVSASPEIMATITDMVQQIDVPTTEITELRVFHLVHADPVELADQLTQLFPDTSRSGTDNTGPGFGFRFGGFGRGANAQATSSDRTKKKSTVLAVPDPRTSSLLVAAASELMPHIAQMIEQLDAVDAKHEVVQVRDLQYADPQDVQQVLQDLFNRQNTMKANNNNTRSLLGQNNPLTSRATSTTFGSSSGSTSGFGNTRGGMGGGGLNTGF